MCPGSAPFTHFARHLRNVHGVQAKERNRSKQSVTAELAEYEAFCKTLDGDASSAPMAHQRALKMQQICIGVGVQSPFMLLTKAYVKPLQQWLTSYASTHKSSSAATYVSVLNNFAAYAFKIEKLRFDAFSEFKFRTNCWASTLRKGMRQEETGVRKPQIDEACLANFSNSLTARNAEALLNGSHGLQSVGRDEHAEMRNLLILLTVVRNCCRSGAPANMTMKEWENKEILESGNVVVFVGNHKTVREHGALRVTLTPKMATLYGKYVDHVRPLVLRQNRLPEAPTIFLTHTGRVCTSDDVHKGINAFWKKAGGVGTIGATLLRANVTTKVLSNPSMGSAERQALAEHLAHRPSTGERWYRQQTQAATAVETADNIIGRVLCAVSC